MKGDVVMYDDNEFTMQNFLAWVGGIGLFTGVGVMCLVGLIMLFT